MLIDPIGDFLARIKNGYLARKAEIAVPSSKFKENLAKILVAGGYLEKFEIRNRKSEIGKELVLTLSYKGKKPVLTDVKRISKPGLRVYSGKAKIPRVLGGMGLVIVSTPQGLMIGQEAKQKGLGGEIICKIW